MFSVKDGWLISTENIKDVIRTLDPRVDDHQYIIIIRYKDDDEPIVASWVDKDTRDRVYNRLEREMHHDR